MKIAVIICAGGSSKRFGFKKKEYQKIENSSESLTVLGSCVKAFSKIEQVKYIAIAIPKNDEENARSSLPFDLLNSEFFKLIFTQGGNTRQESVYNSLCTLEQFNPDYVLIHDGARPWVSKDLIQRVIDSVCKHNAVIPLMPLTETPKEIRKDSDGEFVMRHLKRINVGAAQTPQGFKFSRILDAHKKAREQNANEEFTDDAEVWGRFIGKVAVVPGEAENRKITFKEDL